MSFWNLLITSWYGNIVILLCLVTSIFSYTKIFLTLRYNQNQVQNHAPYLAVIVFWLVPIVGVSTYFWNPLITRWCGNIGTLLCLVTSISVLLHANFSYSSPQPKSSTKPRFSRTTEPSNSTEHSSIQKGSVQCTVGAGNISSLLSAHWYSHCFDASERLTLLCLPRLAIYGEFSFLKLLIEAVALLLEGHRSEASSEGHNQTTLLFIDLIYKYNSYVKKVSLRKYVIAWV